MILYTGIRAISGLQFKGYPGKNRNHGVSALSRDNNSGSKSTRRYLRYVAALCIFFPLLGIHCKTLYVNRRQRYVIR